MRPYRSGGSCSGGGEGAVMWFDCVWAEMIDCFLFVCLVRFYTVRVFSILVFALGFEIEWNTE